MTEERFYMDKNGDLYDKETNDLLMLDFGYSYDGVACKKIIDLLNALHRENIRLRTEFNYDLINVYNLDEKLNFIVNLLFDINCYVDVHYNELLGMKLGKAERLGFNIEPSKDWDYDKHSYEFWRNYNEDEEEQE